jgi:hypothetical protein
MAPDHVRARFTITGSYTLADGDRDAAEPDGSSYVDADFSKADHFIQRLLDRGRRRIAVAAAVGGGRALGPGAVAGRAR